jgi:peroxiredoxin
MESMMLIAMLSLAVILGLTLWVLFHMLKQNGRLLVRLEAVEKKLKIDPNAPEIPGVPVGQPAPAFELTNLESQTVTLESLGESGIPVVLVFTEPTCGACEALHPDIARWQKENGDRITVVPVSRGQVEANKQRSLEHHVSGVLLQAGREVWDAYLVTATPSAVMIKEGKISTALAVGPDAIREMVARATLPPPAKKGDAVPVLKLPDLDGKTLDLSTLRGKRTLLLFWNTGCGFCTQMLDDMKKWERERPDGAPELVVISSGTVEANRAQAFRSRVLLDTIWAAGNVLGASGTPSALMIDEDGVVASDVGVGGPAVFALADSQQS